MKSLYKPHLLTLEELLENKTFSIPVYQRPYSWSNEQVSVLLQDINEYFNNDEDLFIGTIYAKNKGIKISQIYEYELVDGQQRIVTITFIFMSLYTLLVNKGVDLNAREILNIKNILWKYINRENNREVHLINSKALERNFINNLFENSFDSTINFEDYIKNYETSTWVESNIKNVFELIFKYFKNLDFTDDKFLDYSDYLLNRVNIIMIESNVPNNIIFNMFEAINSKGKKLEDIDLIKTYIFSKLDEGEYDQYLKKWGELIAETNDNLEDYLWVYVKAFIKYYRYSIKVKYFKTMLLDSKTLDFYDATEEAEIIKKMIDDLVIKVKYYKALNSVDDFLKITKDKKHLLQFNIFKTMKYEHPKPVILKALYEFDISGKNKNDKNSLELILKLLNSYMIIYQTVNNRDSKDSIPVIEDILERSYSTEEIRSELVKEIVSNKLLNENLHIDSFKKKFWDIEGFKGSATEIGFILLIIHNSFNEETGFLSEDQANSWFEIKGQLSLDHLLVQNPKENSDFKYYKTKSVIGDEILKLKDNSDFPEDIIEGMPYKDFLVKVLNKVGNLRLEFKDSNSSRGNLEITFKDNDSFSTYRQVINRTENVLSNIINSNVIFIPNKDDIVVTKEEDYFILDYKNIDIIRGKKPQLVSIFEITHTVNSNKELVKVLLGYLYQESPTVLESLTDGRKSYGSLETPWLSKNKELLRTSEKIEKSDIYFEANRDAVSLVRFVIDIYVKEYKLDLKKLEIIYKK